MDWIIYQRVLTVFIADDFANGGRKVDETAFSG